MPIFPDLNSYLSHFIRRPIENFDILLDECHLLLLIEIIGLAFVGLHLKRRFNRRSPAKLRSIFFIEDLGPDLVVLKRVNFTFSPVRRLQ